MNLALHHPLTPAPRPRPEPVVHLARAAEWRALQRAFEASGGLADSDRMVASLPHDGGQPLSRLARGIVDREVVHLAASGGLWVPLFQFDGPSLRVRPVVQRTLLELRDLLDDWGIACWFAAPHPLLRGRTPAAAVLAGDADVPDAARADRFVARG